MNKIRFSDGQIFGTIVFLLIILFLSMSFLGCDVNEPAGLIGNRPDLTGKWNCDVESYGALTVDVLQGFNPTHNEYMTQVKITLNDLETDDFLIYTDSTETGEIWRVYIYDYYSGDQIMVEFNNNYKMSQITGIPGKIALYKGGGLFENVKHFTLNRVSETLHKRSFIEGDVKKQISFN